MGRWSNIQEGNSSKGETMKMAYQIQLDEVLSRDLVKVKRIRKTEIVGYTSR